MRISGFPLFLQRSQCFLYPPTNVRVGFWQNGFFADLYFSGAGVFRGFSRRIFSPHFCGNKCPERSSRKIPGKILQKLYNKIPDTFLQRGQANKCAENNLTPPLLFANPGAAEKAPWRSLQSGVARVYSLLEIPADSYPAQSRLTPSSDPNSHFARKALSATPGLAPGGLGTRQMC